MANLLLSLVLVVTQLLSWSATPMYLCLCGSGSLCIDAGPDDCDCCEVNEVATAIHSPGQLHHDHDALACGDSHTAAGESATWLAAPCDCRHVELAGPGTLALARSGDRADAQHLAAVPADAHATVCIAPVLAALTAGRLFDQRPPALALAGILRSVVLRC
jgi:hypothetical protein